MRRLNALGSGAGYSFRREYRQETYVARARIDVLEIVADHYLWASDERLHELDVLAEHFTIVPHGLDLSLGSASGLDAAYLAEFAALVRRVRAPWWSEHVAFTRAGTPAGTRVRDTRTQVTRIGHLAPLPFTLEALTVLERNLDEARRAIGDVPCALENIAAPMTWPGNEMDEPAFLCELVRRTECGLLLDVENLHANAHNLGYDPVAYLDALPPASVMQLHLAGGEWSPDGYVDSHARPISEDVWTLAERACARFTVRAVIVERDERLPPFDDLLAEIERARGLLRAAACR